MRILIMTGLLIAGLMLSNSNHAQTWDAPLPLASGVSTFNSCAMPVQTLLMDNGAFTITAPAVVYRVNQWQLPHRGANPLLLKRWSVTLSPQTWADMSLWVCQHRIGNFVDQCVDGSDEYGNGVPEYVRVPAVAGIYYVVVTGNIENQIPNCGAYLLTAIH